MEHSLFFQRNMHFTRLFRKVLNERLKEINLYYAQWCIVYYLKQRGPATLVEIRDYLNVEKPTISRTVKRLDDQHLIEEIPTKDKRERLIQLSKKGIEVYEKAIVIVTEFENSLIKGIPQKDLDTTFQTIQLLLGRLG